MSDSTVRRRQRSSEGPANANARRTSLTPSLSSQSHNKSGNAELAVHVAQDSLFSSSSGWTNFRGFFNLAILLLFVSNARLALENVIKYGVLIKPLNWVNFASTDLWNWPNLLMVVLSNVSIISVFAMENILANQRLNNYIAAGFYVCLFAAHIGAPIAVTLTIESNPLYSSSALFTFIIVFLKLFSYAHVNYWCRCELAVAGVDKKEVKGGVVQYPNNLTIRNLYYFMLAPTLCYELNFPRSPGRRKTFMIKRTAELLFLSFVIVALYQQWVIPLLRNSIEPFSTMNIGHCVERWLKLAIPNHVIWLICFYTMFHSSLNLLAEILCFADRQFYLDFWNAETISVFWKTWNIPVHRWCVRHVFKPMVYNGYSKFSASCMVFFISAFFHEYLVSVPLHMFRLWAFYGMMAQIPLSIITDRVLHGGRLGNIMMWLALILGQPMAILMYVHDWYIMHYPHGGIPAGTLLGQPA